MSKKWLDTLPADLRQKVVAETRKLFPRGVQLSDEFNVSLGKRWEDRGGKFNRLSAAEQDEIRKKLADVGAAVTKDKPDARAFFDEIRAVADKVQ